MTIDHAAIEKLFDRARREVDEGLLPSVQIGVAYGGELISHAAYGEATIDTRYSVFSCTKAFVAGAVWALIGDGLIDVSRTVASYIPEFADNGKGAITIEQVMLHTSGFPHAPLSPANGATSAGRRAAFSKWRVNWDPGTSYEYHPTSAHWVLAELIEVVTGSDYRDVVEARVTGPTGLPRLLGLPVDQQTDIAELVNVGDEATASEIKAAFGVDSLPATEVTPDALIRFNDPEVRAVGVPGGGGVMRASDLALYYQALLHNPGDIWRPDILADATGNVRSRVPERHAGYPANRSLGLILAGDDGFSHVRGMGRTVSAGTFGHNGAGGQIAWGDPVTGVSFGYCTSGLDRNVVREPRRGTALASLAGVCAS